MALSLVQGPSGSQRMHTVLSIVALARLDNFLPCSMAALLETHSSNKAPAVSDPGKALQVPVVLQAKGDGVKTQ